MRFQIKKQEVKLTSNLIHRGLTTYTRSFPISKGKRRLVSFLWRPLSFGQFQREVELRQARVKMYWDIRYFIQRQLYFFGAYEAENCDYWIKLASSSQTIFDLGANVGLYTLLAAATNPNSAIHSFEPTPEVFENLSRNVVLNRFKNIQLNQLCVGDKDISSFLNSCNGVDQSNEGMNFVTSEAGENTIEVQQVTLDEYCHRHDIAQIDLMKMDIEGAEYKALLGAQRLLEQKAINCIFMEMIEWSASRAGNSIADIRALLSKYNYHLYRLEGSRLIAVTEDKITEGDFVVLAEPHIGL